MFAILLVMYVLYRMMFRYPYGRYMYRPLPRPMYMFGPYMRGPRPMGPGPGRGQMGPGFHGPQHGHRF